MGGLRKKDTAWYLVLYRRWRCPCGDTFGSRSVFTLKKRFFGESYATGHMVLFYMGVFGAFLTALYTFRMIWIIFFGEENPCTQIIRCHIGCHLQYVARIINRSGRIYYPPLQGVLPESVGHLLEVAGQAHAIKAEFIAMGCDAGWSNNRGALYVVDKVACLVCFKRSRVGGAHYITGVIMVRLWCAIRCNFVKPFCSSAAYLKWPIDKAWLVLPKLASAGNKVLSATQTGSLRGYAAKLWLGHGCITGAGNDDGGIRWLSYNKRGCYQH